MEKSFSGTEIAFSIYITGEEKTSFYPTKHCGMLQEKERGRFGPVLIAFFPPCSQNWLNGYHLLSSRSSVCTPAGTSADTGDDSRKSRRCGWQGRKSAIS